jgi:hypothetical protein
MVAPHMDDELVDMPPVVARHGLPPSLKLPPTDTLPINKNKVIMDKLAYRPRLPSLYEE